MSQQAERRVGSVIANKWRVDALLGSGSMAAVYAVTHRNGARSALKILHPALCTDPALCERFLGEGYLTNSVKHAGIVRVLDDGVTDDGCVFLVMDLLEGRTLETLRQDRGGRMELREVLDIADKLMDVLRAVHEAGIIHRDLKPQNVFICDDGSVKLLDFGVARVFEHGSRSKVSIFGLVLGTPSFMSPEQAVGAREEVDHRTDIWSLGATLFTVLAGETVHLAPNVQAKLLAAATVKARSIAMVRPDLPAPIVAAMDTALRFKKEERWQSVDAFRRAIRESRVQLGLGMPPSTSPPTRPDWFSDEDVRGGDDDAPTVAIMFRPNAMDRDGTSDPLMGSGEGSFEPSATDADSPSAPFRQVRLIDQLESGSRTGGRRSKTAVWFATIVLVVIAALCVGLFAVRRAVADVESRQPETSLGQPNKLDRAPITPSGMDSPRPIPGAAIPTNAGPAEPTPVVSNAQSSTDDISPSMKAVGVVTASLRTAHASPAVSGGRVGSAPTPSVVQGAGSAAPPASDRPQPLVESAATPPAEPDPFATPE